jgi:hypothetical protein
VIQRSGTPAPPPDFAVLRWRRPPKNVTVSDLIDSLARVLFSKVFLKVETEGSCGSLIAARSDAKKKP